MNDPLVRRRGQLIEAEIDDELVGLDVEEGTCFGFNATATRVWSLLETPRRVSELRDALLAEYDVDAAQCEHELHELLRALEQDRLIEIEPAGG